MEIRSKRKAKKKSRECQRQEVLKYLQEHGVISESMARDDLKMSRCAPRICELRTKGHEIKTIEGDFYTYYKYIRSA